MTGSLRAEALAGDPHRRALLTLDDGTEVAYRDVRRFGTWLLLEPGELEPYLGARLGEEPLVAAFTAKGLGERLEGRRAALKAALLDQRTLAGLGNIYVDEALWYAQAASAAAGRLARSRRAAPPAPGDPEGARARHRPPGLDAHRLPATRRQLGLDAEGVQGLRARRRAVRPLRHADREDPRRGPRHLVLPDCQTLP